MLMGKPLRTRIGFTALWIALLPAVAAAIEWPQLALAPAITGFSQPVHITNAGDGSGRLFVVEQGGTIRIVKSGVLQGTAFLDIHTRISCCGERGLLSVAFPPSYTSKGYFYVYYTNTAGDLVIARYFVTATPDVADANSEVILLTIGHPINSNHNGGQNYGWRIMEGFHCYNAASCDMSGLTLPVSEYSHAQGDCSVTGGFVYRAAQFARMQGIYFYARSGQPSASKLVCVKTQPSFASRVLAFPSAALPARPCVSFGTAGTPVPSSST
jgi:hypothetical protein